MKKWICIFSVLVLFVSGCQSADQTEQNSPEEISETEEAENLNINTAEEIQKEEMTMILKINGEVIETVWETNESVSALHKLAAEKPLTIRMSMYGGWEQVGSIGKSLPRNDVQTTAVPGDIMLYSGNQIVLFYGNNSWAYTKLGSMQLEQSELESLLGNGDVTVEISAE